MRLSEAKRDPYRKQAKEEGYRSRAAYKIRQLNDRFHFVKSDSCVVDIGSGPGGWLQVIDEIVGARGFVLGVDLEQVLPISSRVRIIQDDVTSRGFADRLREALGKRNADCVLADLSPKLSGIWDMDHFKQIDLCMFVVDLMPQILRIGGASVLKAFQGEQLQVLVDRLKKSFGRIEITKPDASRRQSSEVYLVSLGFTGRVPSRPSEESQYLPQSELLGDSIEFD